MLSGSYQVQLWRNSIADAVYEADDKKITTAHNSRIVSDSLCGFALTFLFDMMGNDNPCLPRRGGVRLVVSGWGGRGSASC